MLWTSRFYFITVRRRFSTKTAVKLHFLPLRFRYNTACEGFMEVYWEYAFAENCLIDGLLLYLALRCARGKIRLRNLFFASLIGGAEAVLFPLIALPVWCAYLLKFLGGVLLAVLAVSKGTRKTYFVVCSVFFLLTFALGGVLTAVYSFFGISYVEGQGYLVESAPVALVLTLTAIFAIIVREAAVYFYRYRTTTRNIVPCKLLNEKRSVNVRGFFDSGNCLTFRGNAVCVASATAIFALFGEHPQTIGSITVTTVNASRISPVFLCGKLQMTINGKIHTKENVYLTVGEICSKDYQIILHTALGEVAHEDFNRLKTVAAKDKRK